jgi:hypothetical protein
VLGAQRWRDLQPSRRPRRNLFGRADRPLIIPPDTGSEAGDGL